MQPLQSSSAQRFFFVEESGSLTESQHTVSLTGSHSLPATATAAQLITAATITASVQRHRHRENDTATAAIAEPLVIKRGCCDNLCGNYVVIVFAKVSLGFLVVIRVVVCCCFNLLKCSDGRVNLFRPCRSLCRHCCRYTLFVEDLNLMLDSGEKRYL